MSAGNQPPDDAADALPVEARAAISPGSGSTWAARLRWLFVWAGIATLAGLTLLALTYLLSDLDAVSSIRGGRAAILDRLAPTLILGLAAIVAVVVVGWLSASGRRREMVAIAIGFIALIGLRVFLAATLDGVTTGEPQAYSDRAEAALAGDLAFGDRPMGYTWLLAGSFGLFGDRQLATEALNLLLATLAGGSVLAMARSLYGPRVGAIALLGYALWPAGALMTTVRMPETAYDLAIVTAALALTTTANGWRGSAWVGVFLGVSQWLRPSTPALLPIFLLARVWPGGPWRRIVAGALVPLLAAFLLILTPVIWHNAQENGSLSISTSRFGGQVLYLGTNQASGGTFDREAMEALVEISGPELADRSRVGTQIALERIRQDPLGIAALALRKQDTLWGTERFGVEYGISRSLLKRVAHPRAATSILLSQAFYFLVLLGATTALFMMRRRADRLAVLVVGLIWTVAGIHALLEVRDRHHSYVIPLLLPLAALALAGLLGRIERLLGRSAPE